MTTKLIPGGEIRMIKKGDKSTYKGETKEAQKDYVMIKTVYMKSPVFIDEKLYRLILEIFSSDDIVITYPAWFK